VYITVVLGTAYFLVITNIAIIAPLLGFMRQDLVLSNLECAIILSAFPVLALPSNLIFGPLADRIGRQKLLAVGSFGCAIMFLSTTLSEGGATIAALRAGTGVFMPMVGASVFAAVPDYFDGSDRARITGYVTAASSVAQLLAVPMGVFIAEAVGWRASLGILSLCGLVLGLMVLLLPKPKYTVLASDPVTAASYAMRIASLANQAGTRQGLIGYMFYSAATFVFIGLYPTWLLDKSHFADAQHAISWIFLAGGVGGLLGAVLSSRVSGYFDSKLMLCAIASGAAILFVIAVPLGSQSLLVQMLCYGGFSVLRAIFLPTIITGTMALVAPTQRGSLNGLLNAAFQCATAAGSAVSTWLFGVDPQFYLNAVVSAGLFAVAIVVFAGRNSREQRSSVKRP
jgi:predicted MFS family arabinose efflux permease